MATEKFCLKWNAFQQNIVNSFQDNRKDTEYSDVTLVCEDDQQIEAHKIILSANSPFFSQFLKRNKHSHPMIYMRGLKAKDLAAVVDFIYLGEANVYQEDLDAFLALAEELQLKGLAESQDDTSDKKGQINSVQNTPEFQKSGENKSAMKSQKTEQINSFEQHPVLEEWDNKYSTSYTNNLIVPVDRQVLPLNADIEEIKAKIDSMTEKTAEGEYRCTVCGKMLRNKADMGRHIETHIEGISYPCGLCGKVSRSSMGLTNHLSRYHRK
jgi:hypothetical protein